MWTSDLNQMQEIFFHTKFQIYGNILNVTFIRKALESVVANLIRQLAQQNYPQNSESAVSVNCSSSRGSSRPAFSMSVTQPPAPGDKSSAAAGQPTITRGRRNKFQTHNKALEHASFVKKLFKASYIQSGKLNAKRG